MEEKIPVETYFSKILWNLVFHKIHGKCYFHQFIYSTVKICVLEFVKKYFNYNKYELMESACGIQWNSCKAILQWNLVFHLVDEFSLPK